MVPPKKRKTGVFGFSDLNKRAQKKQKTGIFTMNDLKKKPEATKQTGTRRLQDIVATELYPDDGLMVSIIE